MGEDLSILIPKPLKGCHREMIKVENISGKLLMTNKLRRMVCLNREGFLVPMELGVRLNVLIENGIQFCGAMSFKTKSENSFVMLVDKLGTTLEMTKPAVKYFERGSSLLQSNKGFEKVFKVTKHKAYQRQLVSSLCPSLCPPFLLKWDAFFLPLFFILLISLLLWMRGVSSI